MSHLSLSFLVFGPQLKITTKTFCSCGSVLDKRTVYERHGKRRLEQLPLMPK